MWSTGTAKIFVRKTSCLYVFKNSVNQKFCHVVSRRLGTRITLGIKSETNSRFLEKFLESCDNRLKHASTIHRSKSSHECRAGCWYETSKELNSNFRKLRLNAGSDGEAGVTCGSPRQVQVAENGQLDLMILDVADRTLHSFDPVYLVVKPFTPTADDILTCQEGFILPEDVISRENYDVTFVYKESYGSSAGLLDSTFQCSPVSQFDSQVVNSSHAHKLSEIPESAPKKTPAEGKPSNEQLERIFRSLSDILPKFFVQPHDYSIYHKDIIFNNNIRGVTTKGLPAYVKQLALVRIVGHLKFAHVKMDVLKITTHPEDSTVRVRWRIRGISGMKIFLKIWKVRFWNWRELLEQESDWYDGFSTFYVGSDGLIQRHVCDKMMPDEEKEVVVPKGLVAKLGLLFGLTQRPFLEDLDSLMVTLMKLEEAGLNPYNFLK